MAFGCIYNVFDGCELLEASLINSKENGFNENVVVYQTKSYYGNKINEYDIEEVISYYLKNNLIDKAIKLNFEINAKNSLQARQMEKQKYQAGLDYLIEKGFDYFRVSGIDEFFLKDEFSYGYKYILDNNIDRAFCRIITYSDVNLQDKSSTDNIGAVFLYKIKPNYKMGEGQGTKIRIDDIVKYGQNSNDLLFPVDKVMLHHFRLTRINLKDKVYNSTILDKSGLINQMNNIENIKSVAEAVPNLFNIDVQKFKNLFFKNF